MFKICITDKYELHNYTGNGEYYKVGSFNTIKDLKKYTDAVLCGMIMLPEIDTAVQFMSDTSHNTAEFGYNGTFTVSYFDENIEE